VADSDKGPAENAPTPAREFGDDTRTRRGRTHRQRDRVASNYAVAAFVTAISSFAAGTVLAAVVAAAADEPPEWLLPVVAGVGNVVIAAIAFVLSMLAVDDLRASGWERPGGGLVTASRVLAALSIVLVVLGAIVALAARDIGDEFVSGIDGDEVTVSKLGVGECFLGRPGENPVSADCSEFDANEVVYVGSLDASDGASYPGRETVGDLIERECRRESARVTGWTVIIEESWDDGDREFACYAPSEDAGDL
jgi:uncharacterized membrane protein YidH (DUF202 family)